MFLCIVAVLILTILLVLRPRTSSVSDVSKKMTLRIVLWDYAKNSYDKKIVAAFENSHPYIHIEVISYPAEYYLNNVFSLLEGGEDADVIYMNQQYTNFPKLARRNILLPLNKYMQRDSFDFTKYPDMSALSLEGGMLGIPYRKDKLQLFYNKTLFDLADLSYPKEGMTWAEFLSTAQKLQDKLTAVSPGTYALKFANNTWRTIETFNIGEFNYQHTSLDKLCEGIELMLSAEDKGLMPTMASLYMVSGSQHLFEQGNFGMFIHGTWYANFLATDQERKVLPFRWGMTSCPVWDTGQTNNSCWTALLSIYKNTRHPEEAWEFIRFVTGKEGASIMADEVILPAYSDDTICQKIQKRAEELDTDLSQLLTFFSPHEKMLSQEDLRLLALFDSLITKVFLRLTTCDQMREIMEMYRGTSPYWDS